MKPKILTDGEWSGLLEAVKIVDEMCSGDEAFNESMGEIARDASRALAKLAGHIRIPTYSRTIHLPLNKLVLMQVIDSADCRAELSRTHRMN